MIGEVFAQAADYRGLREAKLGDLVHHAHVYSLILLGLGRHDALLPSFLGLLHQSLPDHAPRLLFELLHLLFVLRRSVRLLLLFFARLLIGEFVVNAVVEVLVIELLVGSLEFATPLAEA